MIVWQAGRMSVRPFPSRDRALRQIMRRHRNELPPELLPAGRAPAPAPPGIYVLSNAIEDIWALIWSWSPTIARPNELASQIAAVVISDLVVILIFSIASAVASSPAPVRPARRGGRRRMPRRRGSRCR